MTDYIKREDAIKAFDPKQRQDWYTPWIVETLEDLPPADVAPVRHGRWEVIDEAEPRRYGCSICRRLSWYMDNYCSSCGAKMDEEETK